MLQFAVAGVPLSTPKPGGTVEGLKHAHSLGIEAMEMEWVQNVPKNPERMEEIRITAKEGDMTLTVHAPYYINLNSPEPAKLAASKRRILDALTMSELAGVRSVCVHPAFYLGQDPAKVFENLRRATEDILKHKKLFPNVNLAYETMGKTAQFGTLEEVLKLSKEFDLYPCVDPAHMHARTNGKINSTKEWNEMFDAYEKYLGKKSLTYVHMHFSGIAYAAHGEKHHLPLKESDAKWMDFLKVLKDRKIGGTVVCESPLLEKDTLLMKETYDALK
ncbi:hypothetical protein A3D88_01835 [Candidatus Peribacteria bacterium RIFCSPHIGHO2_02_FULL_52_16]|nr:MAG: hypothetical protein A2706_05030 [Candidatus Peribacteria bacterium RIFCSPHIGHO2_01_FULL_51_35]OGJ61129.1 MAG: hypothetical protein A3D88_01835 [Candidatus Peribacteria bacterium RIFCSPHIGHO2_02_FULL_52_16]